MSRTATKLEVKGIERDIKVAIAQGLTIKQLYDGGGLFLDLRGAGLVSRLWRFKFNHGDKRGDVLGIGKYPAMPLGLARAHRDLLNKALTHGVNPRNVTLTDVVGSLKKIALTEIEGGDVIAILLPPKEPEPEAVITFQKDIDAFFAKENAGWCQRHREVWLSSMQRKVSKDLREKATTALTYKDADAIRDQVSGDATFWVRQNKSARELLRRCEAVVALAMQRDRRSDEPRFKNRDNVFSATIEDAPEIVDRTIEHHPAMPLDEMPAFWTKLTAIEHPASYALQLMLLCGINRTGELRRAIESHFVGDRWQIPAGPRGMWTKSGRPRVIKLSPLAQEVVAKIKRSKRRPVGGSGPDRRMFTFNNDAMRDLLWNMGYSPEVATPHGFRSTFTDWAQSKHPDKTFAREMALDHKTTGALGRAYERYDYLQERYELGLAWEAMLTSGAVADDERLAAD